MSRAPHAAHGRVSAARLWLLLGFLLALGHAPAGSPGRAADRPAAASTLSAGPRPQLSAVLHAPGLLGSAPLVQSESPRASGRPAPQVVVAPPRFRAASVQPAAPARPDYLRRLVWARDGTISSRSTGIPPPRVA